MIFYNIKWKWQQLLCKDLAGLKHEDQVPATKLLGRSPIPTFQALHSAILGLGLQTTFLLGSVWQRGLWSGCWGERNSFLFAPQGGPIDFLFPGASQHSFSTFRWLTPSSGSREIQLIIVFSPTLTEPASSGHLRHQHQQSRPFLRRMGFSSITPPPNVYILIPVLLALSLRSPSPEIATSVMKVKVSVVQSCPTLCNPIDCSPPGSSVHGTLQARILEWVAIPFSRGIFPTQGSSQSLPHRRQILYLLSLQGTPTSVILSFYYPINNSLYFLC